MSKLRTVFMGTPDFAVPCLKCLADITQVAAVVTQPDRPKGRGQRMQASPVKQYAEEAGLSVYQPEKVKTEEFTSFLAGLKPDLVVVVAFGQILSQRLLDIPPLGCINVHASLLPNYRGAAPIHWAIIKGEHKTGVTTMFMDAGLDTGDMLLKAETEITPQMTTAELHDKLMVSGAALLADTIKLIENGTIVRRKQIYDENYTYASLLTKETGHIDWSQTAQQIHDLIRGLNSWPGAYSFLGENKIKIWQSAVSEAVANVQPGEIYQADKSGIYVGTGSGLLQILELQFPGKNKMTATNFLCGHKMESHTFMR